MNIDKDTATVVMAIIASIGLFLNAIVHWDKISKVIFSHVAFIIVEYALLFGCYRFGYMGIIVGANVYVTIVFFDFIRRNDTSCASIGSAILAATLGTFCFSTQFALVIK